MKQLLNLDELNDLEIKKFYLTMSGIMYKINN